VGGVRRREKRPLGFRGVPVGCVLWGDFLRLLFFKEIKFQSETEKPLIKVHICRNPASVSALAFLCTELQ